MQELAGPSGALLPLGDHPLVTVIVACYNQEAYIEDTLLSALGWRR